MAFNHTFKYLYSGKEVEETKSISAQKAIRYKCLDCSGGSPAEIRGCGIQKCPLWPFRMGKNRPFDEKSSERMKRSNIGFKKKSVLHAQHSGSGEEK
jgi:hypothetical protein